MTQVENNIKEWIKPLLEERGLSVEEFTNIAGISRAAIYHYFTDKYRPTEEIMAKMCRALGVPLEEGLAQYTPRRRGRPAFDE